MITIHIPENVEEMVTTERVAIVVWQLAHGVPMHTVEVAQILGITQQGAWSLLAKLCRVLPVSLEDGTWKRME